MTGQINDTRKASNFPPRPKTCVVEEKTSVIDKTSSCRRFKLQQPAKFELYLNLKTAKALGLNMPDKLPALDDKVIE